MLARRARQAAEVWPLRVLEPRARRDLRVGAQATSAERPGAGRWQLGGKAAAGTLRQLRQTATRRGTVCNRETGGKEGDGVLEDGFWAVCGYVGRVWQRVFG